MSQFDGNDYLQKDSSFKLDIWSVLMFVMAAFIAWEMKAQSLMIFSSSNHFYLVAIGLIANLLLLYVTYYLLKRNKLSIAVLGLNLSKGFFLTILIGTVVGVATVIITALILHIVIPYHFVYQSLSISSIISGVYSYLLGAFLEELMFRGFLLVVLAKMFGWRSGVLIMALPFGLFHLQGGEGGVDIVATTTMYSFVFALCFVLTRSLWAAVFAHATVNVLLHVITGLDGGNSSTYKIVLDGKWPTNYPAAPLTTVVSALIVSVVLYAFIVGKEKRKNLISAHR